MVGTSTALALRSSRRRATRPVDQPGRRRSHAALSSSGSRAHLRRWCGASHGGSVRCRSRPCARCCARSRSNTSSCRSSATSSDRRLSVAIGSELGLEQLVVLLGGGRTVRDRRRARGFDRSRRPDPHELRAGTRVRGDREQAALGQRAERGLGSISMPADYYELLGVSREREQRRHQACVPALARELHPGANPDSPERRARFQGGRARLRGAARTPSGASATTGSARAESPAIGDPTRRTSEASATSSTRSSVEVSAAAAVGLPVRHVAPISRSSIDLDLEQAVFGAQAPVTDAHRGRVRGVLGLGRRRRNATRHVLRVQRHRPGPPGAAVDPRPDGHGRPMYALRWRRRGHRLAVLGDAAATAAPSRAHLSGRHIPGGVDNGSTALRNPGSGGSRPARWAAGDLLRPRARPSARPVPRKGTISSARSRSRSPKPRSGTHLTFDTLDGAEDLVVPCGHAESGRVFKLRGRGVPHLRGRSAAT